MSFMTNDFFVGFFLGGFAIGILLILIYRKTAQDDMKTIAELHKSIKDLERKNAKLIHFIKFKLPLYSETKGKTL